MDGEAQKNVNNNKTLQTYQQLQAYLEVEYEDKTSILDIHNKLVNKRKKASESYMEYMYDMFAIGGEKMDEISMVRYVADGINEDTKLKLTLYKAKSQKELKQ